MIEPKQAGEEDDDQQNMTIKDEMIVLRGEFDLISDHTEDNIRSELVEAFKSKFHLITKSDFNFVKGERNTIIQPIVKSGHKWDFVHVKNLCGQGKLHVQLTSPSEAIIGRSNIDTGDDTDDILLVTSCNQETTQQHRCSRITDYTRNYVQEPVQFQTQAEVGWEHCS